VDLGVITKTTNDQEVDLINFEFADTCNDGKFFTDRRMALREDKIIAYPLLLKSTSEIKKEEE
jgi:hypothetical protein